MYTDQLALANDDVCTHVYIVKLRKRVYQFVNMRHHYGNSLAIWDHTVLPATLER